MPSRITFERCQRIGGLIYGKQNDITYSTDELVVKMLRYATVVLKGLRKNDDRVLVYYTLLTFSWAMAVANRLHISVSDELWRRFPLMCPYCCGIPCECTRKRKAKRSSTILARSQQLKKRPRSVASFVRMLRKIYPSNELPGSVVHLVEEAGEVQEAFMTFRARRDNKHLNITVEELIDVIAHVCAISSIKGFDLAESFSLLYKDGCPACHKHVCKCGLTEANSRKSV